MGILACCLSSSFSHHYLNSKKHRCCAWGSNPGPQVGRRRRIHWAMATPLKWNVFKNMGQPMSAFVYFLTFHNAITNIVQNLIIGVDGVLEIRTRGRRLVGTDVSTELIFKEAENRWSIIVKHLSFARTSRMAWTSWTVDRCLPWLVQNYSVTRLGYFWKFFAAIFFTKVAQICGDLLGFLKNMTT